MNAFSRSDASSSVLASVQASIRPRLAPWPSCGLVPRAALLDEVCLVDIDDLHPRDQPGRRLQQAAMQQVEQGGAMDADAVRQGMQVGVAQVEDRAAAIGACLEPDDARAARDRGVAKAELAQ